MKDFPWGYVVGAAVTVIGLLLNQWRADRREADRWSKEVQRDAEKWERERAERLEQWQREDHARAEQVRQEDRQRWFDERRALYVRSMKLGRRYVELLGESVSAVLQDDESRLKQYLAGLREARDDFEDAVAEVELVATDSVQDELFRLLDVARNAYWSITRMSPDDDATTADLATESAEVALDEYFRAMKDDLGISDNPH